MELYRKVRLACRDGMSERAAAKHFGISRESVKKMLSFSVPPGYRRTAAIMVRLGQWTFEIIKRSDTAKGFELLPRRWVVERTFAWLGRCRRLAKDFESSIESAVAWILIAHIRRLTRRLVRA